METVWSSPASNLTTAFDNREHNYSCCFCQFLDKSQSIGLDVLVQKSKKIQYST